jgi:hypothetical protein
LPSNLHAVQVLFFSGMAVYICKDMKKLASFSILLLYFAVSSGFVVNLHYCMNKLHSWELGTPQSDKCGQCGMDVKESGGCCHDEVKIIKLQQDLVKAQSIDYRFSVTEAIVVTPVFDNPQPQLQDIRSLIPEAFKPPPGTRVPIYISNRVFRI